MVVALVPSIVAQSTLGTLIGTAVSDKNALIPSVQITLTNTETKATYKTSTNESGEYALDVPEGTYSLTAERSGLLTSKMSVVVTQNKTKRLNVGMSPSDPKEREPVRGGMTPVPRAPVKKAPPNRA